MYICIVLIYISGVYILFVEKSHIHTSAIDGTEKCLHEENLFKSINLPICGESLSV